MRLLASQYSAMEKKITACADAETKPVAAYWYEEDVPVLLREIEDLRNELYLELWRKA